MIDSKNVSLFFVKRFDEIYHDMHSVFNLNTLMVRDIIIHFLSVTFKDDFYKEFTKVDIMEKCLKKKNLIKLREFLLSIKLKPLDINVLLICTPEILLFSNRIMDIYPLFKSNEFKGYALLNGEKYKSYDSVEEYFLNNINNLQDEYSNLYAYKEKEKQDFENNLTVRSMLELLKRKDVMDYYDINSNSTLRDKFDALSSRYNKRNYYFYKVENPLIALKVKKSTYDIDKKYHCDLCNNGYDNIDKLKTAFIIPLEENGNDEIYNIVCLCQNCFQKYQNKYYDNDFKKEEISALKRRIGRKNPEYLNKIHSYFKELESDKKSK